MSKNKDGAGNGKVFVSPGQYVYLGPDLRSPAPLPHATVFAVSLPAWAEQDADIKALCLPVAQAGKALRELQNGISPLQKHYHALNNRRAEVRHGV